MLIEQAIFTSRQTDRASGYHLVATSPGVSDDDAHMLSAWGPSHDSLCDRGSASLNFFALPSGDYCVSRTQSVGGEYSHRGGEEIYTQCLIVAPAIMDRFAWNPFALIRAALGDGRLVALEQIPRVLEAFRLRGGASPLDDQLQRRWLRELGPRTAVAMVDAVVSHAPLAVVSRVLPRKLLDGLVQCLPVAARHELSLSTGLRISSRRSFRVQYLSGADQSELRRLTRQHNLYLFSAEAVPVADESQAGSWGQLVVSLMQSGRWCELSELIADAEPCTIEQLHARSQSLFESHETADSSATSKRKARPRSTSRPATASPGASQVTRGDAAHSTTRAEAVLETSAVSRHDLEPSPAHVLGNARPDVLSHLEQLDDTVFDAIAGKPDAMARLQTLWPETIARLGPELLEESREQYLRHAREVWQDCAAGDGLHKPEQSLAALQVISLLLDETPDAD